MRHSLPVAIALLALTLLPTDVMAAWPTNPYSGNVLVTASTGIESFTRVVPDGAGGCIVVWQNTSGNPDIAAQRFDRNGNKLWATNGITITNAANAQGSPAAAADGAGGVVVAWVDDRTPANFSDIYAQKVNANGTVAWAANGVAVCTEATDQSPPEILSDRNGGAFVVWGDSRNGSDDIFAQRINSAGAAAWTANGVTVTAAASSQIGFRIANDDANGLLVVWEDFRSGTSFDIYGQGINSAGSVTWLSNGRVICTSAGNQRFPDVVADGAAGAYFVWADLRNTVDYDLYAQRTGSSGLAVWAANGVAVCAEADDQYAPRICLDGTGGFITAFEDERAANGVSDLYAQRVAPGGNTVWNAAGVAVSTSAGDQFEVAMASDGAGGAILTWLDERSLGADEIYAARLSPLGTNLWTSSGVLVSNGAAGRTRARIVSDGTGGALLAWDDFRDASGTTVRLQRVERYGFLGDPAPTITQVRDVPNDQGRSVKVSWNASHLDADPTFGIVEYRVFRSVPPASLAALRAVRALTHDSDVAAGTGALLVRPSAATDAAWEFVGTQVAEAFVSYSRVAATTSDSVGGSNPRTLFMVEARASTSVSGDRWFSLPDSGYSVDNLAPAVPAPLTGYYSGGSTRLFWNPNRESDLAGYRLYRGSSTGFVPGPGNLVAALPDTGAVDAAGGPFVYKLTAIDLHGNESPVATLVPQGTLDAPSLGLEAFFAAPSPNPARGGTVLRFGLARAGAVRLALHDASGRLVRTLVSGEQRAGEHAMRWDGRSDHGLRAAPGLYLARLEAAGEVTRVQRVMVLE